MTSDEKLYKVLINENALRMMYTHIEFLANVSVSAARKLRDTLYRSFSSLETLPHRCPVYRTHKTYGTYRQLIVGRYIILFSIDEQKGNVDIDYILDSRQENDII